MTIDYFEDSDTLQITLNDNDIVDTVDVNENVLAEFDKDGQLVSLTIEHAKNQTDIKSLMFKSVSNF